MPPNRDPVYRVEVLVALCLALVVLAVFWPLRSSQFTNHDDPYYVTKNPNVQQGLSAAGAWWALTTLDNSNWHPLTWLSLQLDYQVYRLDAFGYLVTNLLLHLANALLLFWVFRRMTGAMAPSALVAALFAIHPLHVESVAWVSERKDVLSALFWVLTMWAYLRYVEKPGVGRYGWVILAFALGLTAKPMLVTLPFVLLLLDYWPLRRFGPATLGRLRLLLLEKLPLLVLAGASCVITFIAQSQGGAVRTLDFLPLASRGANAVVAYATYLVQMVWPRDLAAHYPYEVLPWSDWRVWGAGLLLAGMTTVAVRQATRRPFLLVGWLWYVGTLVPVIGLVQVGAQAHADRYTYVPLIGVFVMLAWTAADLARRGELARRLALAGSAAALVGCVCLTWAQVAYWHDSVSLWRHTLAVTGPNPQAHCGLGFAYREEGKLELAAEEFRRALAIEPRDNFARANLGWVLFFGGRLEESRAQFTQILQTEPDNANAHFQLGVIASMGGKVDEAVARYAEVLRLRPEDATAHVNLAVELTKQGHYESARRHLGEAERYNPRVRDMPAFQEALRAAKETPPRR